MPRFNPTSPLPTGPILRMTSQIRNQSQLYENVWDLMAIAPVAMNSASALAVVTAWAAQIMAPYRAVLPPTTTLVVTFGADITQGVVPTQQVSGGAAAGTAGATSLTGTVAGIITKYSSLRGQHGRGRSYIPSVPNTFVTPGTDPNLLNGAAITAYTALGVALMTPVVAGGSTWNLCISSRPLPPATLVTGAIPVTSLVVQATLGTVRRRREGVGI